MIMTSNYQQLEVLVDVCEINYIASCGINFCCNSWMKELFTSKLFCRTS